MKRIVAIVLVPRAGAIVARRLATAVPATATTAAVAGIATIARHIQTVGAMTPRCYQLVLVGYVFLAQSRRLQTVGDGAAHRRRLARQWIDIRSTRVRTVCPVSAIVVAHRTGTTPGAAEAL